MNFLIVTGLSGAGKSMAVNALEDIGFFCIICIFPVIVSMGAGGKVTGKRSTAVCKFLGDISYPIYITHYPLVYTYTAWVCNNNATMAEGIPYMILTFVGAVVLAYACLKLYDEPVRKWLTDRFLKGKKK